LDVISPLKERGKISAVAVWGEVATGGREKRGKLKKSKD
jgi:hypothetical protein